MTILEICARAICSEGPVLVYCDGCGSGGGNPVECKGKGRISQDQARSCLLALRDNVTEEMVEAAIRTPTPPSSENGDRSPEAVLSVAIFRAMLSKALEQK